VASQTGGAWLAWSARVEEVRSQISVGLGPPDRLSVVREAFVRRRMPKAAA